MCLPDVNLWLALAFESHFHHSASKNWFEALSDDGCSFCRLTQQGFLRLATNPKAFGTEAVTLADAWRMYDAFLGDPARLVLRRTGGHRAALARIHAAASRSRPKFGMTPSWLPSQARPVTS